MSQNWVVKIQPEQQSKKQQSTGGRVYKNVGIIRRQYHNRRPLHLQLFKFFGILVNGYRKNFRVVF